MNIPFLINHPNYSPLKYITVSCICLSTCMYLFIPILDGGVQRMIKYRKRGDIICGPVLENQGWGGGGLQPMQYFAYMLLPLKYCCHRLMCITCMAVSCQNNIY